MARNAARGDKLIRSEDGTFGCMWGYIMDVQPIEMCVEPHFFDNCRGNLLPADLLRVTELKGVGDKKTVTATCTLIVMRRDDKAIYVELYEGKGIHRYDVPADTEAPKVSAEEDFYDGKKYIKGDGRVEKPEGGDYEIHTNAGLVSKAQSYDEAMAISKGEVPLNV